MSFSSTSQFVLLFVRIENHDFNVSILNISQLGNLIWEHFFIAYILGILFLKKWK